MPIRLQDLYGLTPEEIAAKYSPDELDALLRDTSGPGFFDRAQSGFATTPAGEVNILRRLGYDAFLDRGTPMVRTAAGTQPVDPEGFESGDFADMLPRLPRTLLGTLGGLATSLAGGVPGAAAGGVAGAAIEQGIGNYLGSQEGVNAQDLLFEGAVSGVGQGVGLGVSAGLKKLAAPFKGSLSPELRSGVVDQAAEFGAKYGGDLENKLPLSAQTTNPTLQMVEQRVAESPSTLGRFSREVQQPFEAETQQLFDRMLGNLDIAKNADTQSVYQGAIDAGVNAREMAVNQAYKDLDEIVAANMRVTAPETLDALQRVRSRMGAGSEFEISRPTNDMLDKLVRDAESVTTFKQLDDLRRMVGSIKRGGGEQLRATGIAAQLNDIYGALARDAENIFRQGGRLDESQLAQVMARESEVAARRAAVGSAKQLDLVNISQAIERVGGLNTAKLPGNISPRVMRRLRGVETMQRNAKRKPLELDQMAEELRQRYPQVGIETPDDLLEALRRDDRFYRRVAEDVDEEAASMFAERAPDLDFRNVDAVESAIQFMDSNELAGFGGRLADAVERGDMSKFDADRLTTRVNQRLMDLEGGASESTRAAISDLAEQQDIRASQMHREMPARAQKALGLAREDFELMDLNAANLLRDPSTLEGLAPRVMRSGFQPAQVLELKKVLGAVDTPQGVKATAEGQRAWQMLQAEILTQLRDKAMVKTGGDDIISGANLETAIKGLGGTAANGERKLRALFGDELAGDLINFAKMMREARVSDRYANRSRTGQVNEISNFFRDAFRTPFAVLGKYATQVGIGAGVITPRGRRFLTEGVAQGATGQRLINTLGRAAGQIGTRQLTGQNR